MPSITHDWCERRLKIFQDLSENFALQDIRPDGTPQHLYLYIELKNILHAEVFHLGFELPRCHPPDGGYSWTPPVLSAVSAVSTLSFLGEDAMQVDDPDF